MFELSEGIESIEQVKKQIYYYIRSVKEKLLIKIMREY